MVWTTLFHECNYSKFTVERLFFIVRHSPTSKVLFVITVKFGTASAHRWHEKSKTTKNKCLHKTGTKHSKRSRNGLNLSAPYTISMCLCIYVPDQQDPIIICPNRTEFLPIFIPLYYYERLYKNPPAKRRTNVTYKYKSIYIHIR